MNFADALVVLFSQFVPIATRLLARDL
ncbi:hypothetical protein DSM3645_13178 [Blastopirellula marina DSM 3645]|uniref:Uncharacterized protein n=1 Tax=Blastopirellula marina DSM 3645 TaxID=314230 RepID=A4A210_9BACT|nr:hypothetical protein DSM3645_13178 [Blastopirellula marina DSM 3645]